MQLAEPGPASDMISSEAGQPSIEPSKKASCPANQFHVALEDTANETVRYSLVLPLS